jgi:hypothetical protein
MLFCATHTVARLANVLSHWLVVVPPYLRENLVGATEDYFEARSDGDVDYFEARSDGDVVYCKGFFPMHDVKSASRKIRSALLGAGEKISACCVFSAAGCFLVWPRTNHEDVATCPLHGLSSSSCVICVHFNDVEGTRLCLEYNSEVSRDNKLRGSEAPKANSLGSRQRNNRVASADPLNACGPT